MLALAWGQSPESLQRLPPAEVAAPILDFPTGGTSVSDPTPTLLWVPGNSCPVTEYLVELTSGREVFARSQRPVEVLGPAIEDEGRAVHEGFWTRAVVSRQ